MSRDGQAQASDHQQELIYGIGRATHGTKSASCDDAAGRDDAGTKASLEWAT